MSLVKARVWRPGSANFPLGMCRKRYSAGPRPYRTLVIPHAPKTRTFAMRFNWLEVMSVVTVREAGNSTAESWPERLPGRRACAVPRVAALRAPQPASTDARHAGLNYLLTSHPGVRIIWEAPASVREE